MKTVDYLIWILVLIGLAIIIFYWQSAFADEIKDSQTKIGSFDIRISVQKGVMNDADKALKAAQDNIRQVKKQEGRSWDFIPSIAAAQKQLDEAVQNVAKSRADYMSLLKQKSDEIKNIKLLRETQKILDKQEKISNYTYAVTKKIILIQLSDKCSDAVSNNFTTTCPSYRELRSLDTSIQKITGKLFLNGTREKSQLKDSWRYYDHDDTPRTIVNPPGEMLDRYPLIRIESNFDTYLQDDSYAMQGYVLENNTRGTDAWGNNGTYNKLKPITPLEKVGSTTLYHDRFVTKSCKYAIINADKGRELLLDTIKYMHSGCTLTEFDNRETVIIKFTTHDISSTQKYRQEKWASSIDHTRLKIGSDNSTNRSVTEDRMPKYVPKVHPPFEYPK